MKQSVLTIFFIAGLIFTSCKDPISQPLSAEQKAAVEKEVLAQWELMGAAVERSDAKAYISFFSDRDFLAIYSQGTAYAGLQAYADTVQNWFGQRKGNEMQEKEVKITVFTDSLALVDVKSMFRATFKNDTVVSIRHVASFLFKREETGWKVIHGHESWK